MIYLSGPVTNIPDYRDRFFRKEMEFLIQNKTVFNPVTETRGRFGSPENIHWTTLMEFCLDGLFYCDEIYMMRGWRKSYGARVEHLYAQKLNIKITYEEKRWRWIMRIF